MAGTILLVATSAGLQAYGRKSGLSSLEAPRLGLELGLRDLPRKGGSNKCSGSECLRLIGVSIGNFNATLCLKAWQAASNREASAMRQRLTRQLLAFSTQCHEACAPQQPEETTAADAGTCFQAGELATSLVTGQEGNAAAAQAGSSNRPAELTAMLPHLLGLRLGLRSSPSVHFQPMKSKSLRTAQSTCTTAPNH